MNRKILITGIVLLMVIINTANSQTSRVFYFMKVPQNHLLNPALKPANRFYIGLPVISGIHAGFGNNFLSLTDFLIPGVRTENIFTFQDQQFNLSQLSGILKKSNTVFAEADIQIAGLGFPIGKNYSVFFDVNDRITSKAIFPRDLMDLYVTGPSDFIGKTLNISDVKITGQLFREYGAGFSGEIIKNLRIGAKLKLLSGITSMSFENDLFSLTINNDLSQVVTTDATLSIGGQESIRRIFNDNNFIFKSVDGAKADIGGFLSDYFFNKVVNSGFAVDLGAVYNLGSLFTFSASITDLGFISWKNELKSYRSEGTYTLPGITLADVQAGTFSIDDMVGRLADTIQSRFLPVASPEPFKTRLPGTFLAGGSINLLPIFSIGLLSETRVYAGNLKQSLIFSGNLYAGRALSASLSYTIANASYNNLGIGLAVKTGPAQIYFVADKIPLTWEKFYFKVADNDYSAISLPVNFNTMAFQFGVNIAFGKPVAKKADIPMIVEEVQEK